MKLKVPNLLLIGFFAGCASTSDLKPPQQPNEIRSEQIVDNRLRETRPEQGSDQTPDATNLITRSLEVARLEAQIAHDHNAYRSRPKRVTRGSDDEGFAHYLVAWRQKVERIGNLNYPEEAKQKKLYGRLKLTVHIRADGSLEGVDINLSSGSKILDDAAIRIVHLASPYAPFPEDTRRDYDILDITRTWTFTHSDQISGE